MARYKHISERQPALTNKIAQKMIENIEGDNGCYFSVSVSQAEELNKLCEQPQITVLSDDQIATLTYGEHSEMEELIGSCPVRLRANDVLNEIFNSGYR